MLGLNEVERAKEPMEITELRGKRVTHIHAGELHVAAVTGLFFSLSIPLLHDY